MAEVTLFVVPPVKGLPPSYFVMFAGLRSTTYSFPTATEALRQYTGYTAAGHTLFADPKWLQAQMLLFIQEKAWMEQQQISYEVFYCPNRHNHTLGLTNLGYWCRPRGIRLSICPNCGTRGRYSGTHTSKGIQGFGDYDILFTSAK